MAKTKKQKQKQKKQAAPKATLDERAAGLVSAVHGLEHDSDITSDRIETWRKEYGTDAFDALEARLNLGGNHGIAQALHWVHNNADYAWTAPDQPAPAPKPTPTPKPAPVVDREDIYNALVKDDVAWVEANRVDAVKATINTIPVMYWAIALNAVKCVDWFQRQGNYVNGVYYWPVDRQDVEVSPVYVAEEPEIIEYLFSGGWIREVPALNGLPYANFIKPDMRDEPFIARWSGTHFSLRFNDYINQDHPDFYDLDPMARMAELLRLAKHDRRFQL